MLCGGSRSVIMCEYFYGPVRVLEKQSISDLHSPGKFGQPGVVGGGGGRKGCVRGC